MKNIQKYMMIVGLITVSTALQAVRLLGTEGQESAVDKVTELQQLVDTNSARLHALKAEDTCKDFIPNSVECAKKAAEKAGLIAQNISLQTSIFAIKGRRTFDNASKPWHNDVAKNIVTDEEITHQGIAYGEPYGDNRSHNWDRSNRAYEGSHYENRGIVGGAVEGSVNAVEDVGQGVGAAVEDVGSGIVYGDQYGDNRFHRFGRRDREYEDSRYEDRGVVGGAVEGSVNAVEDVGQGVGAAVEDVGAGIGSLFGR